MIISRSESALLEQALDTLIATGNGTTCFITGEPGIGKSTFVQDFLSRCDDRHDLNVLTATGRCIDLDGISHGYLPWKEALIELDADRAAGKDLQKKQSFKTIIKTLFDESGSEWIQNIPLIGDISAAIVDTAHAIHHSEQFDTATGESRDLSFRERLEHVVKESTGAWLGAIPIVGGLAEAIFKTSRTLSEKQQTIQMRNQEDFFILVMSRLRELAKDNPVVVFLDDLQWADASSLSLLLYLAKNLQDLPYRLLLLGSYRPEDIRVGRYDAHSGQIERHPLEEKLNILTRYGACRELGLSRLDAPQMELYVNDRFARHELDRTFIAELREVTEGNALFVQEMVTNMVERGFLAEREGVWRVVAAIDYSMLPRTVEGVIRERYERLSEDLQELLQIAAVEGVEFALDVVEAILQENRIKLDRKIDRLMHKHELVRKSTKAYEKLRGIYEFTHNLVQKYIYHSMDEEFRKDVHRAIAETLKAMFDEERINPWKAHYSYHLGVGHGIIDEIRRILLGESSAAGMGDEGAAFGEYYRIQKELAEGYIKAYNNDEAIRTCSEVIGLAVKIGDRETEVEYLQKKGEVLRLIGAWDAAVVLYKGLLGLGELEGQPRWRMEGHLGLGQLMVRRGDYTEAISELEQTLELCEELGDQSRISLAIGNMGTVYSSRGEYDLAIEYFERALRIAEELGDQGRFSYVIGNMGTVYSSRGDYDRAIECYERQLRIAEELGDRSGISMALGNMGVVYNRRGEYDRAIEYYERQLRISEELGDRSGISLAIGNMGNVYYRRGEYDRAIECLQRQLRISEELGDRSGISLAIGNMGYLYSSRREYDRAMECYEQALRISEELGDRREIARAIGNMGSMYYSRGEYDLALESLHHAAEEHRAIGYGYGLTSWLQAIGEVLVELVQAGGEVSASGRMPEYLPRYIPGATEETWHAASLRYARTCAEECIAISDDISNRDTQFSGRVLLARIEAAEGSRDVALQRLTGMLEGATNDGQRAELHYWLWKLGEPDHAAQALALYKAMYEAMPNHDDRKRIEELTAAEESP